MNENIYSLLETAVYVICFCLAIVIFINTNTQNNNIIDALNQNIRTDRAVIEVRDDSNYTIKGSDIILGIHNGLETDISVSGIEISGTSPKEEVDYSFIDVEKSYTVSREYNSNGELIMIEYN